MAPGPRFDGATWSPVTSSDSRPAIAFLPTRASSRRETFHVQQAALTGESMPAEKDAGDSEAAPRQPADARNVVFLGTSVVSGTATALVVATGPATAFGDIAARLSTRPPETEFERGTRQFALLIMRTVFFLVLFVLLAGALLHHAF